ncbi:CHAT domain-containing protein [Flammeovirga kamogawensis]|uniref:CHAT domain-containing protein n=1 Tax=Flammeovirga kamogawensis TaxID=373891 RepID=A0ABX8H2T3_9BACT|nr:CHAT domain-containing protein [Flammeovirga kamogawensis]MBB6464058.1 CHAT domain-containing protein [Flammeovirga kamogawensis]QWG09872.1 CHAT domain-containing protein [Flammeovirga kamogawensis]TRX65378.1 CHAT domain-containing protein [Flammeovirga kamogawensis]
MKNLLLIISLLFCAVQFCNATSTINNERLYVDSLTTLQQSGRLIEAKELSIQWINKIKEQHGEVSVQLVVPLIFSSKLGIGRREYKLSIHHLEEAIAIMNKTTGWLYPDYGLALNLLILCKTQQHDLFGALGYLNEVEVIYQKTLSTEHIDYGYTILNKALIEQLKGNFLNAEGFFFDALEFNEIQYNTSGRVFIQTEWIKVLLADLYVQWYKPKEATELLKMVDKAVVDLNQLDSPLYAQVVLTYGDAMMLKENFDIALSYYNKFEKNIAITLGKSHPWYFIGLHKIAKVYKRQSKFETAKRLLVNIEGHYNPEFFDKNEFTEVLLDLAKININQGYIQNAEDYLAKIQTTNYDKRSLKYYYLSLKGKLSFMKGDYIDSELHVTELISLIRQEKVYYSPHYNTAVVTLVDLDLILGRLEDAKKAASTELNFLTKREMSNSIDFIKIVLSDISAALALEDTVGALVRIENCEKLILEKCQKYHYLMVRVNYLKGIYFTLRNELDKAQEAYALALTISQKLGIQSGEYYSLIIIDAIANILVDKGELDNALEQYNKLTNSFSEASIYQPALLGRIAYIKALKGEMRQAEKIIIKATNMRFSQYEKNLKFSSEDEKIQYIHNTKKVFSFFFTIFIMQGDNVSDAMLSQCYNIQLNYRKYFLNEAITRNKKINDLGAYRDELRFDNYLDVMVEMKSQLAAVNYMSKSERKKVGYNSFVTRDRINNLEKSLVYASDAVGDTKLEKNYIDWSDIQTELTENEIALEIIKINDVQDSVSKYIALCIHKNSEVPNLIEIGEASTLEGIALKSYTKTTSPASRSLTFKGTSSTTVDPYSTYWKPIKSFIDSLAIPEPSIIVSNDAVYNLLSLNTLKNPKTGKNVIEEDKIRLVTSTSQVFRSKDQKFNNKDILLMGNPEFSTLESREALSRSMEESEDEDSYFFELDDLPATAKEVQNTEELFKAKNWNVTSLTREKATENYIKNLKTSPSILHIATHGFYINQLSNPVSSNALLKSGLFFSEISDRYTDDINAIYTSGNDGILTAYEAKSLNLKNTRLVILSACQTGLTDVSEGDGISGLQYAFSIAGAKSIIMSLWSVDDRATQLLMNTFYERWMSTGNKEIAFREAQLVVKKEYVKPYYWGAFILVN